MSKAANAVAVLPWPSGWSSTPRTAAMRVLISEFLGFLGLVVVGLGTLTFGAEERGGPAVIIGLGAFCVGTLTAVDLLLLILRRRKSSKAVSLHTSGAACDGVAIFYSSRLYRLLRPLLLATGIVVAGYAVGAALGWASPPPTRPPDISALTGGAALCLLSVWAAWLVWAVVEIADGRVVKGRLVLSPDGIYHRSYTFEHFVPWQAVIDVCANELGGPVIVVRAFPHNGTHVRRTNRVGRQREFKLLPLVVVRGRSLGADPATAYHALRYYEAHPDARAELLSPFGEERIRAGNLID